MNKVKFMDYPVDEAAHLEVHEENVAELVVNEIHSNWVHLMYDWGFPPEIEAEDEVPKRNEIPQVHLMNYSQSPQQVNLVFDSPVRGRVISPDGPEIQNLVGDEISFILDIYSILILDEPGS